MLVRKGFNMLRTNRIKSVELSFGWSSSGCACWRLSSTCGRRSFFDWRSAIIIIHGRLGSFTAWFFHLTFSGDVSLMIEALTISPFTHFHERLVLKMIFHIEIMPLSIIIAIIFRIQVQFALLRQLIHVVDITLCNRLRLLVFLQNLSCHLRRYQSWLAPSHRRIRPAYFHHFNVIILGFIIVGGLPILFQSSLVYPAYLLSILTIFVHWKFLLSSGICLCILFSLSLL